MTHVVCESKLRSVVRSSIHPCQGNWVAIGHTVVYYAGAVHAFSAIIECRHCNLCGILTTPAVLNQAEHIRYMSTSQLDLYAYLMLTRMLLEDNFFNTKMMQKTWKMSETLANGTHLRLLTESFPMNTNMTEFRWFPKFYASLCFIRK